MPYLGREDLRGRRGALEKSVSSDTVPSEFPEVETKNGKR